MSVRTRSGARALTAAFMATTGLLVMAGVAQASTASVTAGELEVKGYKCERAGAGGWICKKPGDKWLCPNLQQPCIDLPGFVEP